MADEAVEVIVISSDDDDDEVVVIPPASPPSNPTASQTVIVNPLTQRLTIPELPSTRLDPSMVAKYLRLDDSPSQHSRRLNGGFSLRPGPTSRLSRQRLSNRVLEVERRLLAAPLPLLDNKRQPSNGPSPCLSQLTTTQRAQ